MSPASTSTGVRIGLALVTALSLSAAPARGQTIPFSQRAGVTQSVGFTSIEITYGRPVARGRTLFPGVVKWGQTWNPGADSATRIAFNRDVTINGAPIAAGDYSIWLVPREQGPWTFILHHAGHVFHTPYPGDSGVALRLDVTPESGAHMETLAIYFPAVVRDSAVMRIHWGTTVIPVSLKAPWRPSADDASDSYLLSSTFGRAEYGNDSDFLSYAFGRAHDTSDSNLLGRADDAYFLSSAFGKSVWTPTLPSTSWVMRRSAAMLDS